MRVLAVMLSVALGIFLVGCPAGPYDKLPDGPQTDLAAAQLLWENYLKGLGDPQANKEPLRLTSFFANPLLASSDIETFQKQVTSCIRKRNSGLFEGVKVKAVKQAPEGLLMIIASKAGDVAIPIARAGDGVRFAELNVSTGDWAAEATHGPATMPEEPSLLYLTAVISDESAAAGDRLRAALGLAKSKYRQQIIANQRSVTNPIVRLGLGLARTKIDGFDESFVKNFPADADSISALRAADPAIFEEMLAKLSNLGAMVEDPPANEALFRSAGGAPAELRERFGKALYDMAEQNPARFANAVFNVVKDMNTNASLAIYFEEVKRHGGQAPKALAFLKKFSREGEAAERKLCQELLGQYSRAR